MDLHLLLFVLGSNATLTHALLLFAHLALLFELKKSREMRDDLIQHLSDVEVTLSSEDKKSNHIKQADGSSSQRENDDKVLASDTSVKQLSSFVEKPSSRRLDSGKEDKVRADFTSLTSTLLSRNGRGFTVNGTGQGMKIVAALRAPKVDVVGDDFRQVGFLILK